MQTLNIQALPVAIIGSGPVGLAAAAHLVKRNMSFILFEVKNNIAANVKSWEHVQVFSPWEYNLDAAAVELLKENGWQSPDKKSLPTGKELIEAYLEPLSELPSIAPYIYRNHRVIAINRKNLDKLKTQNREREPFVVQTLHNGQYQRFEVRAVIDASGTWQSQNPAGSGGVLAMGESENSSNIFYGIPPILEEAKERYANKNILVVGSGHSAAQVLFHLSELTNDYPNTHIHWVIRKANVDAVIGGKEKDQLPARGAIGQKLERLLQEEKLHLHTGFHLHQIEANKGKLNVIGLQQDEMTVIEGVDEIIACTGSRPDFSFLREIRLDIHPAVESVPALADLIDPNVHSCGTVPPHGAVELQQPEKDFYVVGMKSYGRAPTFLMATGYEQVRSVVAALAGDWKAAKKVNLVLPETGVCGVAQPISTLKVIAGACCGGETLKKKKAEGCC
ncbi:MAG: NAD(P)-binding domain-containing protein [Chitinophagales bacterium]